MNKLKGRIEKLPVLLEELQQNLLNYDELRNQKSTHRGYLLLKVKLLRQENELEMINNVEKFITHMLISDELPFEEEVIRKDGFRRVEYRIVEQLFFTFNRIFEHRPIRNDLKNTYFSQCIQFGLDLELFLECFSSIEHNSLHFFNRIWDDKNRLWAEIAAVPSRTSNSQKRTVNTLFTDTPTLYEKRKIFGTSEIFYQKILSKEHAKKLNTINTNCSARYKNACEYVSNLFDQHKFLTFIALDLCFPPRLEDAGDAKQKYLKSFKNRIRQHSLFSQMEGFLGKWEYSHIKDTYIRMIFVFKKTDKHMEDQLPEILGSFWKNSFKNRNGSFHFAFLASGKSKLNATLCSISLKQDKLRLELEKRTIFYLTYSQSYYRYKYPSMYSLNTFQKKGGNGGIVKTSVGPRDIFFKGELPADVIAAKKEIKEKNKKIKRNQLFEKRQQEVENKELELIKENFLHLMNKS